MDAAAIGGKLAALTMFSELSDDGKSCVAEILAGIGENVDLGQDEVLIHAGYLSFDTGYLLIDGTLNVGLGNDQSIQIDAPTFIGEMSQFRASDTRTATVKAAGAGRAVSFSWEDLFKRTRERLSESDARALETAFLKLVWDRFAHREIETLPLFKDVSDDVRLRSLAPFTWMTMELRLKPDEVLFKEAVRSDISGYILVSGSLSLTRHSGGEKKVSAPDILGIFPIKPDKEIMWSATARALSDGQLLKFDWEKYNATLTEKLSKEEHHALLQSMKNNARSHFWY